MLSVLLSLSTGCTSTLTTAGLLKLGVVKFVKLIVFCSPGLMKPIVACLTMSGLPDWTIRSVTGMFASCESPESSITTWNVMFVRTTTVVCVEVLSSTPCGCTLTETRFVPRRPPVLGVTVPPRILLSTVTIEVGVTMSAL